MSNQGGHTLYVLSPSFSISMASYRLMHRITGAMLTGYIVLSASQHEIDQANHNLKNRGSEFRFIPNQHEPSALAAEQQVVQAA